jgi:hypothetical protein
LLALILLWTQFAYAENTVPPKSSSPAQAATQPAPSPSATTAAKEEFPFIPQNMSSEGIRMAAKNKLQFTFGFIGREYVATPITMGAGYIINPNTILTLRYSVFNGLADDGAAEKLRAVTLGLRIFMGNSFNIMPTAYYRRNTSDYFRTGDIFFSGNNNLVYEDLGVGFRIGNEWQWEHFMMGCDWLGINKTVKELHNSEHGQGIIDENTFRKSLTITAFSFYIGYEF